MRSLGAYSSQVAQTLGTEPLIIVKIYWQRSNTTYVLYADKDIATTDNHPIEGKIVDLGGVESIVSSTTGVSNAISVTLDDTDGTIKTLLKTTNPHKVIADVLLYYPGTAITTALLLFKGEVNSPMDWSEGERTVRFDILSKIEDKEVGFSPEESQLPFVNISDIGKAWPLVFGNCIHVPAVKAGSVLEGQLQDRMSIPDISLYMKRGKLDAAMEEQVMIQVLCIQGIQDSCSHIPEAKTMLLKYGQLLIQLYARTAQLSALQKQMEEQKKIRDTAIDKALVDAAEKKIKNIAAQMVALEGTADVAAANNFAIQIRQGNASFTTTDLATLAAWKDAFGKVIKETKKYGHVRKKLIRKLRDAQRKADSIKQQIAKINGEICRQNQWIKASILVAGGHLFPQSENVSLIIKGLTWQGHFDYDVFSFNTPGVPGPLYYNGEVQIGPALWSLPFCDNLDGFSNIDKFWIVDGSQTLKGMYALVTSYANPLAENVPPTLHIIKIVDQDDQLITFELPKIDQAANGRMTGGAGDLFPDASKPINTVDVTESNQVRTTAMVSTWLGVAVSDDDAKNYLQLKDLVTVDPGCIPPSVMPATPRDLFTIIGPDIARIIEVASVPLASWLTYGICPVEEVPTETSWIGEFGDRVTDRNNLEEVWVCNLLDSDVKCVCAYRTDKYGVRRLMTVPESYYNIETKELVPANPSTGVPAITVTLLRFPQSLKSIAHENWEEPLYVTIESSVGPNVVDVIEYLITTYCQPINGDKVTCDATSFNAVKAEVDDMPVNFAVFDRKSVRTLLQEIAFQARLAIYEKNNVFYIINLAKAPIPVATLDETNVLTNTLAVSLTDAESLVTEMDITWRETYIPPMPMEEPRRLILRHNVKRYGLKKQSYDWYIYNDYNQVLKAATYWCIRNSNVWKHVTFKTTMDQLALEALDCIYLDFDHDFLSTEIVACLIDKCTLDTATREIDIACWVPIRVGEMIQYIYAWPNDLPAGTEYPSLLDVENGYAGGDGIGITVTSPP